MSQGNDPSDIRRLFKRKYQKTPLCRYSIRRWYAEYTARGSHEHTGCNGRPQISSAIKNMIKNTFNNDLKVSTLNVASQVGSHQTTFYLVC